MISIGGHRFEPTSSGRCGYCSALEELHINRITTVDAASDGHPIPVVSDGGSSGVASTAAESGGERA